MGEGKIMISVTVNELDSSNFEKERLNLRIIASKQAFPVSGIVESVVTLLKGNAECLSENDNLFDNTGFMEEGDL